MDQITVARPKAISIHVSRWNAVIVVKDSDGEDHIYIIRKDPEGTDLIMEEEK